MHDEHDQHRHFGTHAVRTAHAGTSGAVSAEDGDAKCPSCRSVRTEQPSPISGARAVVAEVLDALLEERWAAGDNAVSNRALAERFVGVDERTIRKWRTGEKPVPLAALLVLPESVAIDLWRRLVAKRLAKASVRELVAMQRMIGDALAEKEGGT